MCETCTSLKEGMYADGVMCIPGRSFCTFACWDSQVLCANSAFAVIRQGPVWTCLLHIIISLIPLASDGLLKAVWGSLHRPSPATFPRKSGEYYACTRQLIEMIHNNHLGGASIGAE